jgi:hypothetical protein
MKNNVSHRIIKLEAGVSEIRVISIRCLQVNESSKINPIINAEPRDIRTECLRDLYLSYSTTSKSARNAHRVPI